jgi:hypothetical protein
MGFFFFFFWLIFIYFYLYLFWNRMLFWCNLCIIEW